MIMQTAVLLVSTPLKAHDYEQEQGLVAYLDWQVGDDLLPHLIT
jgi:hypothetical protein